MDTIVDMVDNIKACRTCGIHFVTPSKYQLKHLFQSCKEHPEIMLIRLELAQWNVEISENDGFPQYICNSCIHKFEQVFQLRAACINAQMELRKFYTVPNGNIKIKSEIPDENEESPICDFVYVDELSDTDYDGVTPFNIPHAPIKEEVIEAAAIPMEESEHPLKMVEYASRIVMPTDSSYPQETGFVTQNGSVTVSQTNANLQTSPDAVECGFCHQISSDQDSYKHHMQIVHDVRDLECYICGKEFKNSTSARLKLHMKWHTLKKQLKCNCCAFVCHSKDVLKAHKRRNHQKTNCKICGKDVLAKKMKLHLHQHELQKNYSCEYCGKAFASDNEREIHIWHVHAAEDKSSSEINYQTFYTHQVNDNTLSVKEEENIYQEPQENVFYKYYCAHCEHRFVKQMDLMIHVKEEHRGFRTTMIVDATQMEKTSETVQNFNEQPTYEKGNKTEVGISNDPSKNSSALTQEIIDNPTSMSFVTQNENKQKDDIKLTSSLFCNKDFVPTEFQTVSSNMSTYVDSEINTFACAKCSETFASIELLRHHHEQHLSAEQYKSKASNAKCQFHCNYCGKVFDLKFRLNRHINKHKNHAPL